MLSSFVLLSSPVASHPSSFSKKLGFFFFFILLCTFCTAQIDSSRQFISTKDTVIISTELVLTGEQVKKSISTLNPSINYKKRQWLVTGVNVAGYGASLIVLNNAWYKNEPRTSFQTFDDTKEWLQTDKVGHAWTTYNLSRSSAALWKWAGIPHKKAVLLGGLTGTVYQTAIEFLDAHAAKWGWSWSDIGANVFGSGIYVGQEFLWNEQRIQFKFSFHKNKYSDAQLHLRANDLFGASWYERMLKDYNAQTYWLSANLKSFAKNSNLPDWLNISVGYGADGLFGGFENKWMDEMGNDIIRADIARTRQFYIAPDIDFTKIKTKSKFLKLTFSFLNSFKCPAPALMLNSKGKLKAYAIYF
jgi:hypothetical protein